MAPGHWPSPHTTAAIFTTTLRWPGIASGESQEEGLCTRATAKTRAETILSTREASEQWKGLTADAKCDTRVSPPLQLPCGRRGRLRTSSLCSTKRIFSGGAIWRHSFATFETQALQQELTNVIYFLFFILRKEWCFAYNSRYQSLSSRVIQNVTGRDGRSPR